MEDSAVSQSDQLNVILQKPDETQAINFSIVRNFDSEINSSSHPQAFTASTQNVGALIGTEKEQGSSTFGLDVIAGAQQLSSDSPSIQIQPQGQVQPATSGEAKEGGIVSKYDSLVNNELLLQAEQPVNPKILSVGSLNVLHLPEPEEDSCDQLIKVGNNMNPFKGALEEMVMQGASSNTCPSGGISYPYKNGDKYFVLDTAEAVEEAIRKHTEETYSHFVVAKKTKAYGSFVTAIDTNSKFRIHWQSRDLTSTEECAVQIPFQGMPFIYIGEKAYMCHLGRTKAAKSKAQLQAEMEIGLLGPKRHRSRLTKKQGCPAKIFVKQIAKFPDFQIPTNSEYLRTQMSQKLRKAIMTNDGKVKHVIQYVGTLPDISEHSNHDIGENTPVKEPVDPLIRDKAMELSWKYGEMALPKQIKELMEKFVEDLFQGQSAPSKNRRRFYPSEKDIANYIYKSRILSKLTCSDQEQFHSTIQMLTQEYPNEHFFFQIEIDKHLSNNIEGEKLGNDKIFNFPGMNEQKFIFGFQTTNQQALLKMYGKHVILTEISKNFINMPFPFYGVFVPTNVDFQMVYCFILQTRSREYIRQGLSSLVDWNPDWTPAFAVADFSTEQIRVFEDMFPSCSVLISDISREECWQGWLYNKDNLADIQGNKDEIYNRLKAIANSYTEEALNTSAQTLENSEEWRLSENLRDWFSSDWLAEAKRWVAGYRHDNFMGTFHLDVDLSTVVKSLRDVHMTHVKNRKLPDFLSYIVKVFTAESYTGYMEKNVCDYRASHSLQKNQPLSISNVLSPSYLQDKPSSVINHISMQLSAAKEADYTVNQLQPRLFWVVDKSEPDITYAVSFGNATTLPSCVCIDWLKYKLPCKHMVTVSQSVPGRKWDMLGSLYTSNPRLCLDFSCIDRAREDLLLASMKEIDYIPGNIPSDYDRGKISEILSVSTHDTNELKSSSNYLEHMQTINGGKDEGRTTGDVSNLVTACNNVCQELSSTIHHVANDEILRKVKLDLQLMLNDVKLELFKTKTKAKKRSSPSIRNEGTKKAKCESGVSPVFPDVLTDKEASMQPKVSSPSSFTENVIQPIYIGNEVGKTSVSVDGIPSQLISEDDLGSENNENNSIWIFDPELNIKLFKDDRERILKGLPLSLDVLRTVQNILRHQFCDVEGLCDPKALAENLTGFPDFPSKSKVLQLHMVDDKHWSASARTSLEVQIFCCTLSSKADILEQVLKMTANDSFGDNILFIERNEKAEAIGNCSLYAIAYSVAFLFDIDARNFLFVESEMRPHLAECLEDMCFSMFPVKTL